MQQNTAIGMQAPGCTLGLAFLLCIIQHSSSGQLRYLLASHILECRCCASAELVFLSRAHAAVIVPQSGMLFIPTSSPPQALINSHEYQLHSDVALKAHLALLQAHLQQPKRNALVTDHLYGMPVLDLGEQVLN